MTYLDIINTFWREHYRKEIKDTDVTFYFFLLDECNSRHWVNPMEICTNYIIEKLGISRMEVTRSRERLQGMKLIRYIPSPNKKTPSVYCILDAGFNNKKFQKKDLYVTAELHKNKKCVTTQLHNKISERIDNKNINEESNKKELQKNPRCVTAELHIIDNDYVTTELHNNGKSVKNQEVNKSENENLKSKTDKENKRICNQAVTYLYNKDKDKNKDNNRVLSIRVREDELPKTPSIEDVREYFQHHQAAERLPDIDTQADEFFYHYDALGWCNGSGVRIIKWQSMASKWIMRTIKERKNENNSNRPSNNRTGLQGKLAPKPEFGLIK